MAVSVPCCCCRRKRLFKCVSCTTTTLFFCCCSTKTEKKWAKEEGRKAEAPDLLNNKHTAKKPCFLLLPLAFFSFFAHLSCEKISLCSLGPFPLFLPPLRETIVCFFAFLLVCRHTVFCLAFPCFFLPSFESVHTLTAAAQNQSVGWALSTHAPTDCSWLTFFCCWKRKREGKGTAAALLLCPLYFYYI